MHDGNDKEAGRKDKNPGAGFLVWIPIGLMVFLASNFSSCVKKQYNKIEATKIERQQEAYAAALDAEKVIASEIDRLANKQAIAASGAAVKISPRAAAKALKKEIEADAEQDNELKKYLIEDKSKAPGPLTIKIMLYNILNQYDRDPHFGSSKDLLPCVRLMIDYVVDDNAKRKLLGLKKLLELTRKENENDKFDHDISIAIDKTIDDGLSKMDMKKLAKTLMAE